MSNEKVLVRGTLVLAASAVIVKILSAAYKIPLTRILGPETMGAFTAVFSIFMPFYAFCVAGIVPSISKITAEIHQKGEGAVLALKNKANRVFMPLAIIMAVIIIITGYFYTKDDDNLARFIGLIVLLPNLFFATSEAIYKGLNQGRLNMIITAKAGILESGVKLVIGLSSVIIAGMYFDENLGDIQLILTLLTISVSGWICKIYLENNFKYNSMGEIVSKINITEKGVFTLAMPIAFSALIVSAAGFFDNIVGLKILEEISDSEYIFYYSMFDLSLADNIPLWLLGIYNGYTLTITNLIPTISSAIGQSSLPIITKTKLANDNEKMSRQINKILKLTGASVIPISVFCYFFANEIIVILFSDMGAATDIATIFLRFIAPFIILPAFSFPLNSILHAYDKQKKVFYILIIASFLKCSLTVYFCSIPSINIKGFIYSSCVFYIVIFLLTILSIKGLGIKFSVLKGMFLPSVYSFIAIVMALYISEEILFTLPLIIRFIASGFSFVVIYGAIILITEFLVDIN